MHGTSISASCVYDGDMGVRLRIDLSVRSAYLLYIEFILFSISYETEKACQLSTRHFFGGSHS